MMGKDLFKHKLRKQTTPTTHSEKPRLSIKLPTFSLEIINNQENQAHPRIQESKTGNKHTKNKINYQISQNLSFKSWEKGNQEKPKTRRVEKSDLIVLDVLNFYLPVEKFRDQTAMTQLENRGVTQKRKAYKCRKRRM